MKMVFRTACAVVLSSTFFASASAQSEGAAVHAKSYDTVSPTGVSYHNGAFVYDLPLFAIGADAFPNGIPVSLHYDSSNHTALILGSDIYSGWTFSGDIGAKGMVTSAVYNVVEQFGDVSSEPLYEFWKYGVYFSFGKFSNSVQINSANFSLSDFHTSKKDGSTLKYDASSEEFEYINRNGEALKVKGRVNSQGQLEFDPLRILKYPNGSGFVYNNLNEYIALGSNTAMTANGFLVIFEQKGLISPNQQRICAYNLAHTLKSVASNCDNSQMISVLKYDNIGSLSEVVLPNGDNYRFEYQTITAIKGLNFYRGNFVNPISRRRLTCVRGPSGVCLVTNVYDACDGFALLPYTSGAVERDLGWNGSRDRVKSQILADGSVINYQYPGQTTPCRNVSEVNLTNSSGTTKVLLSFQDNYSLGTGFVSINYPKIDSVIDQLNRKTDYKWTGGNPNAYYLKRDDLISEIKYPEGNVEKNFYDDRGNLKETQMLPKTGSGSGQILYSSVFPTACTNIVVCNKPTSVADAKGNVTDFTYSSEHGEVLTKTGPAGVNGIRPQTRFEYSPRYVWLKSEAGYTRALSPIFVKTKEEYCKTTSAVNGNCAGGTTDEVVIEFDYGPDAGPNNLLVRGKVVAAVNSMGILETQRTCYSYDIYGRKISETKPLAGLVSCP